MAALGPGLAEQPVTHRFDGGHDHRPHLGVVAHAQVPRPLRRRSRPAGNAGHGWPCAGPRRRDEPKPSPARSAPAARPATTTWPSPPARPRPTDRRTAASATAATCAADSAPDRAAAASAGRPSSRRAVSRTSPAWRTEVPVVRARWAAAERAPASFHPSPAAERAAANPLIVAARFSISRSLEHRRRSVITREQRRVEARRVATHRLPQLPELSTHQPSPDSEGLTWEGADPSKRTGVRRLASARSRRKGFRGHLRENVSDGESAGWPRLGSDRVEEGRGSTGQGAG